MPPRPKAGDNAFNIPDDRPIPEEYQDQPDAWKRAYAYAANYSVHNTVKSCVIFAESRWQDDEFKD